MRASHLETYTKLRAAKTGGVDHTQFINAIELAGIQCRDIMPSGHSSGRNLQIMSADDHTAGLQISPNPSMSPCLREIEWLHE